MILTSYRNGRGIGRCHLIHQSVRLFVSHETKRNPIKTLYNIHGHDHILRQEWKVSWSPSIRQHHLECPCWYNRQESKQQPCLPEEKPLHMPTGCQIPMLHKFGATYSWIRFKYMGPTHKQEHTSSGSSPASSKICHGWLQDDQQYQQDGCRYWLGITTTEKSRL